MDHSVSSMVFSHRVATFAMKNFMAAINGSAWLAIT
jgi:hypothetical protein